MPTARELVTDALDLIAVHAAEEPLTAHQEQQGLRILNDLIQSASLEQFIIYYMPPQVIAWPAGGLMLTWGLGGEIPTPRPVQIALEAHRADPVAACNVPLAVLSAQEWHTQPRWPQVAGTMQAVYYAAKMPMGELWAYPVPMEPVEVTVYPWQPLSTWPDFDTDLLLPPGYDRFLKSGVAMELAPYYDKEASATVQGMRAEAKNNLKVANLTIPLLDVPWFADPFNRQSANTIYLG